MKIDTNKKKISKLLVANRGEIAVRIFSTCRKLGIKTVAIFSEADRLALHVRSADESIGLGAPEAAASYLNIPKVIQAIKQSGADAVHPGYGFLSENGAFAEAVSKAGLIFLGPTAEQMHALGDKEQSKERARGLGIPVLESQRVVSSEELPKLPYPLMIKARAGGGGRGMRIVRSASEFTAAAQSATREALAFFGDGTLFVERYIEKARHVEVQLLGDGTGHVLAIGDRDCSVQRRHQKVLEEAPAFGLSDVLRKQLHVSSEKLLASVAYTGAGTAEFLVAGDEYFFLEVNTRLQVEHPVTEAVTGLDLVELQIRIGQGETLKDLLPNGVASTGHAIELRLCAEKPAENFAPSTGTIAAVLNPKNARFDCGFSALDTVSHYYDSLLGKIIVRGESREGAIEAALFVLHSPIILGIDTNQSFLSQLIAHNDFRLRQHFTRWVETLSMEPEPTLEQALSSPSLKALTTYRVGFKQPQTQIISGPTTISTPIPDQTYRTGRGTFLFFEGKSFPIEVGYPSLRKDVVDNDSHKASAMLVLSPLPGKILEIHVPEGGSVATGQVLVTLESMKMEHPIKAPKNGIIKRMCVVSQQVVEAGSLIAEIS